MRKCFKNTKNIFKIINIRGRWYAGEKFLKLKMKNTICLFQFFGGTLPRPCIFWVLRPIPDQVWAPPDRQTWNALLSWSGSVCSPEIQSHRHQVYSFAIDWIEYLQCAFVYLLSWAHTLSIGFNSGWNLGRKAGMCPLLISKCSIIDFSNLKSSIASSVALICSAVIPDTSTCLFRST